MSHQLPPQDLLQLAVARFQGEALTLEKIITGFDALVQEPPVAHNLTTLTGSVLDGPALTVACQLLDSLDKAGYEIVRKTIYRTDRNRPYGPT
jgi:hypothetical protein